MHKICCHTHRERHTKKCSHPFLGSGIAAAVAAMLHNDFANYFLRSIATINAAFVVFFVVLLIRTLCSDVFPYVHFFFVFSDLQSIKLTENDHN